MNKANENKKTKIEKSNELLLKNSVAKTMVNELSHNIINLINSGNDIKGNKITNEVNALATIIILNKIKNIQKHHYHPLLENIRKQVVKLTISIDTNGKIVFNNGIKHNRLIEYANNEVTLYYNKKGELCKKENFKELSKELSKLTELNDGLDLLSDVYILIFEKIKMYCEKYDIIPMDILTATYEKNKLDNKGNKALTNDIKEVGLNIQRILDGKRQITDNELSKSYESLIGSKYEKAYTIAIDEIIDTNGKIDKQVSNEWTMAKIKEIQKKCNFTPKELYIYKHYLMDNKSSNEVIKVLGISERNFNLQVHNIRQKVYNSDTIDVSTIDLNDYIVKSKKIKAYKVNFDGSLSLIDIFDSLGEASSFLNVDKGNISKVLKGERKSCNGFTFKEF